MLVLPTLEVKARVIQRVMRMLPIGILNAGLIEHMAGRRRLDYVDVPYSDQRMKIYNDRLELPFE